MKVSVQDLDVLDIEAIAKSRVNRVEGRRPLYWAIVTAIAVAAGFYLAQYSVTVEYALVIGGFVVFMWYMDTVSKKAKRLQAKLMKDWEPEQK